MKRLIAAAAAASLVAVAAPAFAASQVGVGYTNLDANGANLGSIDVTGSWEAPNHLGVEGQIGVGVAKDSRVREEYNAAAYGTYTLPVSDTFSIKGRVGYGVVRTRSPVAKGNNDGFAGGGGVQWMFDANNGIRGDYTYQDLDHGHANDWSAGLVHKF